MGVLLVFILASIFAVILIAINVIYAPVPEPMTTLGISEMDVKIDNTRNIKELDKMNIKYGHCKSNVNAYAKNDIKNGQFESFNNHVFDNQSDAIVQFNNSSTCVDNPKNYDSSHGLSTVYNNLITSAQNNISGLNKHNVDENDEHLIIDQNENGIVLKQGYSNNESYKPIGTDQIMYPYGDNILRYDNLGCYENLNDIGIRKVYDTSERYLCESNIKFDSINKVRTGFINANGNVIDQNADLYVPRLYMTSDASVMGMSHYNSSSGNSADVDQIGSIPVNDYDGEPLPVNSFDSGC